MVYKQKFNKKIIIIIVAMIVAGGAVALYIAKHKNKETIHVATTSSATSARKNRSTSSGSSDKTIPASNDMPSDSAKGSSPSSSVLQAPFGTLVSNHHPSLSSSSSEESVCDTTPGASCYIAFTNGNTVKQLPTAKADSNGAVYWNWDVKQAGLTAGKWQIQAYASLNGQTKSSQDNLGLTVQQ